MKGVDAERIILLGLGKEDYKAKSILKAHEAIAKL